MNVGDLVVYKCRKDVNPPDLGTGIVVGFDHEMDPIIVFYGGPNPHRQAFYIDDIEVVSESR